MRLLVYPASKEVSGFARYKDLLMEYDEVGLCAPRGWCNEGDDFSQIDSGEITRTSVQVDWEQSFLSADGVYFAESPVPLRQEYIQQRILQAVRLGKKVYLDKMVPLIELEELEDYQVLQGEPFQVDFTEKDSREICKIPVPVIFIMGTGPNCNKFEVQLALRRYFLKKGYRVAQVGSKRQAYFFGFRSLPDMFFQNTLTIREKIVGLNRFFYQKYLREKPEVMIIGVPGGIMPLSPVRFEELGEMAYLISQAITPDVSILCTYSVDLSQDYLEKMKMICKYRLNAPISYMVLSNTEIELSMETRSMQFRTVSLQQVEEKCALSSAASLRLFCGTDPDNLSQLAECVWQELIEN